MAKHLIQAAVAASQVVGRAFMKALRQEIAASQQAAARAGGGRRGAEHAATNSKTGITLEEAKQILNVQDISNTEDIQKKYEHLFEINDRAKGGTLYLQSKMARSWLSPTKTDPLCRHNYSSFLSVKRGYQCTPSLHFSTSNAQMNTLTWNDVMSDENRQSCVDKLNRSPSLRETKPSQTSDKKIRKQSAVLIPLCYVDNKLSLLYTVRSKELRKHRGEVSFPGGLQDPEDEDLIHTAKREAREEIGLKDDAIDVWGLVPSMMSRTGSMGVTGVLAYVGHINCHELLLSQDEVSEVFAVPLESLCNEKSFRQTQFRSTSMKGGSYTIPVFIGDHPRIWGITAVLTHIALRALLPGLYRHNLKHVPLLQ